MHEFLAAIFLFVPILLAVLFLLWVLWNLILQSRRRPRRSKSSGSRRLQTHPQSPATAKIAVSARRWDHGKP
jgi:hypothetical protein